MERKENIDSIVDRALREVRQRREEKTKRNKRFLKISPLVSASLKF
jgi:hypothetical protein